MMLRQLLRQEHYRQFFIGMLAAFALDPHRNTAFFMGSADGTLGFIDVLPAFTARTAGLKLDSVFRRHFMRLRHIGQAENAYIPIFARMFRTDGAGAYPLERPLPSLRQTFGFLPFQLERRRQNAVLICGFVNEFSINAFGLGFGKQLAQDETGKYTALCRPLRGGNLQINQWCILFHLYAPHSPPVL